jgi:hypothetical protein
LSTASTVVAAHRETKERWSSGAADDPQKTASTIAPPGVRPSQDELLTWPFSPSRWHGLRPDPSPELLVQPFSRSSLYAILRRRAVRRTRGVLVPARAHPARVAHRLQKLARAFAKRSLDPIKPLSKRYPAVSVFDRAGPPFRIGGRRGAWRRAVFLAAGHCRSHRYVYTGDDVLPVDPADRRLSKSLIGRKSGAHHRASTHCQMLCSVATAAQRGLSRENPGIFLRASRKPVQNRTDGCAQNDR